MPSIFDDKQKSLKRRFLLIIGSITFACFVGFGLMIIFWDAIAPQLQGYQRVLFGSMIILYSVLRFSRILRKDKND